MLEMGTMKVDGQQKMYRVLHEDCMIISQQVRHDARVEWLNIQLRHFPSKMKMMVFDSQ